MTAPTKGSYRRTREPLDDPSKLIQGLNERIDFNAPDHSGGLDLHQPDFRSTLYWNPSFKTDANGKATVEFYCSDDVGKLSIQINGIATGGKPFSAAQYVDVVAKP